MTTTDDRLSAIYDKLNELAVDAAEQTGMLKATLPNLVTKDALAVAIAEHDSGCRRKISVTQLASENRYSRDQRGIPSRGKQAVVGGGAFVISSGALWAAYEIFKHFSG